MKNVVKCCNRYDEHILAIMLDSHAIMFITVYLNQ